jgi:hypothetical protein
MACAENWASPSPELDADTAPIDRPRANSAGPSGPKLDRRVSSGDTFSFPAFATFLLHRIVLPCRAPLYLSIRQITPQEIEYAEKGTVPSRLDPNQKNTKGRHDLPPVWVLPFFEKRKLVEITPQTISNFMKHLSDEGLSGKYQKNIYVLVNFLFELARTYDFVQVSPIRPLLHRPSVTRTEKPTLPLEKAKAFFNAIPEDYNPCIVSSVTELPKFINDYLVHGSHFSFPSFVRRNSVFCVPSNGLHCQSVFVEGLSGFHSRLCEGCEAYGESC